VKLADATAITECTVSICYFVRQSLVTRISHFNSEMYQLLQLWNHPEDLYVEEEVCDEVAGDWEEEYKLQCKAGN